MPSSSLPPAADVVPRLDIRDPDVWLKTLAWVVIVGSALVIVTFSFGRDQGIYALVADGMLDGKMPYRDVWDFKPPGIFFVYALAEFLFGRNMMAPRLLEVLALFGGVACMRRITGILLGNRTVGLVGGAVAALIHAQMDFWHTGQPETFGAFFTLLGLAWSLEEPRRRRELLLVAIGVVFGCAALMKPPLGGGALVCAAYLAKREVTRGGKVPRALLTAGWVALGGLVPIALCVLWFWAHGALGELYWTLGEFTPGYTKLSWEDRRASDMLYYAIEEAFFKFSALAAAGVIATIAISPMALREREGSFLVLGIIAIHVAGIAMQGKFFAYHYAATLPLIALLAGLGLYKLWRRCLQGGVGGAIAFFSFLAVAVPMRYAVRDLPQFFWDRALVRLQFLMRIPPYDTREEMDRELSYVADYSLSADREVALWVRGHTRETDSVFVWGFEPVIYWLSERPVATRFIYNVAQRSAWEQERARSELLRDLRATRPAVLVVQHHDVFPSVTGKTTDSKAELDDFSELARWLRNNFELAQRIEDFEIYTRVSERVGGAAP